MPLLGKTMKAEECSIAMRLPGGLDALHSQPVWGPLLVSVSCLTPERIAWSRVRPMNACRGMFLLAIAAANLLDRASSAGHGYRSGPRYRGSGTRAGCSCGRCGHQVLQL